MTTYRQGPVEGQNCREACTKLFCGGAFMKNREPVEGLLGSCHHPAVTYLGITHITTSLQFMKDMHTTHPPSQPNNQEGSEEQPTPSTPSSHPFTNLFFLLNILPPLRCLLFLFFLGGGSLLVRLWLRKRSGGVIIAQNHRIATILACMLSGCCLEVPTFLMTPPMVG